MKCPNCHAANTRVVDSRDFEEGNGVRRRRECTICGKRFSTCERIELINLTVIKRDHSREPYKISKLERGVRIACEKIKSIREEDIQKLVATIEEGIHKEAEGEEIESSQIGKIVLGKLLELDEVAYIRFASVYRAFDNIKAFQKELEKISDNK